MLFSILNSEGFLNKLLINMGLIESEINWLSEGEYFWGILTVANIWKGVGYSSIIYLSAISGTVVLFSLAARISLSSTSVKF